MEPWTEVTSKAKKREDQFVATLTVDDKAKAKGAYKATALDMAESAWYEWIKETVEKGDSAEKTVCLMFWPSGGGELAYDHGVSGYPKEIKSNVKALRKVCGIDPDKKTVCAEEHLMVDSKNGDKYLFSIAFDRNGVKPACAGCKKILKQYAIKDLKWDY